MNQNNNSLAIRFGTIAGLLFIAFYFGCWAGGIKTFSSFLIWSTWLPVIFVIILIGAFQRRKQLGGYMTFKEALVFSFLAYFIFELFYAVATVILFRLIDPQLQQKVLIETMETMRSFMEKFGMDDSQIEDAMKSAEESSEKAYTFGQIFLGLGLALIWDFIKSLIIALISQRKKPEFADIR
jgi:hypothetical protein